jgi:hypothetical protein
LYEMRQLERKGKSTIQDNTYGIMAIGTALHPK